MSAQSFDVAVIGAGLMGLFVALAARERGMSVVILEAESCARHASSASAGGVRSLNRHPAEIALVRAALPLWDGLAARLGHDCGFKRSGQIRVAEDEAALQALEDRAAMTAALGFDHEQMMSRAQLMARIPSISDHCLGALAVEDDGFADPLATLQALRVVVEGEGVHLIEHARVNSLERDADGLLLATPDESFAASFVVNTAGAWGDRIAKLANEEMPLRTAALQMIVTARMPPFVTPVVGSQWRKLSLKQTGEGSVVIGGAYEGDVTEGVFGPVRGIPLQTLAARNLASGVALFPILRMARVVRMWAGLEGMTPDGLPYLGASRTFPGLFHAFGFSAHGFALAPLVGPIVADMLEGRKIMYALEAFSADRFNKSVEAGLTSTIEGGVVA